MLILILNISIFSILCHFKWAAQLKIMTRNLLLIGFWVQTLFLSSHICQYSEKKAIESINLLIWFILLLWPFSYAKSERLGALMKVHSPKFLIIQMNSNAFECVPIHSPAFSIFKYHSFSFHFVQNRSKAFERVLNAFECIPRNS